MELKERIKEKVVELFKLYGIRSVTMDEISAQLGISKKTLYQSFKDKSDLVDEVVKDILSENVSLCNSCKDAAEDAIDESLKTLEVMGKILAGMNPSVLFDLERGYPKIYKRFEKYRSQFLYNLLLDNIRRGKADGLYRQDIEDEVYAKARLEMIILPFNELVFPKNKFTMIGLHRSLTELFLRSMVTPKGLKLFEKYLENITPK